jgi:hypothetical protein
MIVLSLCLTPLLGLWWIGQTLPSAVPSPPTYASASSDPAIVSTFPPEMLIAAVALSTFVAPTPDPTPTPVSIMSTVPPTLICGEWIQEGTVCQMPKAPRPTPTPLADCPVEPEQECVWRGAGRAGIDAPRRVR